MNTIRVIKIGGNIINDANALNDFLEQFAQLSEPKVLVHGGGKLATQIAEQMQVPVKMINGRRITDKQTLEIITMVYAGLINKKIIATLQSYQCNAVGFTGADGNTIMSDKRPVTDVDFGFVGDVKTVDTLVIQQLLQENITPVFSAITHDKNGQLLNTNADTIASELAIALAKTHHVKLYYCFEKNGVLQDVSDENSVIKHIDANTYKKLKEQNVIVDGMLPKLDNCFHAVNGNVAEVCIGKPAMLFQKNTTYTTISL